MTNGEKIKNIYPDLEIISEIKDVYVIILEGHNVWSPKLEVFKSWWKAEYKEPSNSGKPNKSEIPTGSTTDVPENNVGKIEPTKNNLGVDCISREQALDLLCKKCPVYDCNRKCISYKAIEKMPPSTPIRPKGHWYIDERPESDREVICSNCEQPVFKYHKIDFDYRPKYCPNCGAEMR